MILIRDLKAAENEESIGVIEKSNDIEAANAHAGMKDQLMSLLPLILVFAIFYLFILRPQNKKMKEKAKMLENLQIGDKVKTSGGMVVKITKIEKDGDFYAEIAEGVKVHFLKDSIVSKI